MRRSRAGACAEPFSVQLAAHSCGRIVTPQHHHVSFSEAMHRAEGEKDPAGADGSEQVRAGSSCPFQGHTGVSTTELSPPTFRNALAYLPPTSIWMCQPTSWYKGRLCVGVKTEKEPGNFLVQTSLGTNMTPPCPIASAGKPSLILFFLRISRPEEDQ